MDHADALFRWLKFHEPEKLFDVQERISEKIRGIASIGGHRIVKDPTTNGGTDSKLLIMPDWRRHVLQLEKPDSITVENMIEFDKFAHETTEKNPENFRIFGPDGTKSNRLNQTFETTNC